MIKSQLKKKTISAQIVNGFVAGEIGGNPAGVVLDADHLSDADMISIAAKIGYSETAFVSKSEDQDFKLDFFTPNRRINHCGHATIATFSYLATLGLVSEGMASKETVDGPRKIMIKNGAAYMEQLSPKYQEAIEWEQDGVTKADVLSSLGLKEEDLDERVPLLSVNTGNNFIVIGVSSGTILQNLKPNFEQISDISDKLDLIGYYVFATDQEVTQKDATTRMFAPRYDILEESATGMAAGPLACVLHDYMNIKKDVMVIEQGHFMEEVSPSLITVELSLNNNHIESLMAGGYGRVMKRIEIEF